jgi:hypothetical protein
VSDPDRSPGQEGYWSDLAESDDDDRLEDAAADAAPDPEPSESEPDTDDATPGADPDESAVDGRESYTVTCQTVDGPTEVIVESPIVPVNCPLCGRGLTNRPDN